MPSTEARLADLELIAMGAVAVTARAVSQAEDLTLLQWRVLRVLELEPNGVSVTSLARQAGTGLPQASRLVARLRRKGLLRTAKDAVDGRVTRASLTDDGIGLVNEVRRLRRDLLTEFLDADPATGLFIDDEDLHRIAVAFGRLIWP
jgi:DNA-binding MarR family transcriptional regulator